MKLEVGDTVILKSLSELPEWYSKFTDFRECCGKRVVITNVKTVDPARLSSERVERNSNTYDVIPILDATIVSSDCDSGMFVPGSEIFSYRVGQKVKIKPHYDSGKGQFNYRFIFREEMLSYRAFSYLKIVGKTFLSTVEPVGMVLDDYCCYKLATPDGEVLPYNWCSSMFQSREIHKYPYLF